MKGWLMAMISGHLGESADADESAIRPLWPVYAAPFAVL